jgi:hypothetical protein
MFEQLVKKGNSLFDKYRLHSEDLVERLEVERLVGLVEKRLVRAIHLLQWAEVHNE